MADTAFLRRIAVDASCDERTVRKYLAGQPVRPLVRERITYALVDRGLTEHVRSTSVDYTPKTQA